MGIDTGVIRWRTVKVFRGEGIAQLVGYIDGRTCMELLDEKGEWSVEHTPIMGPEGLIGVQATITIDGVSRSDVGVPSNQDPVKGAYSDALKRAAVHFGIGRELYELPQVYAPFDESEKTVLAKPTFNQDTGKWEIASPGYVRYPEDPKPADLGEQKAQFKAMIAARPDLKDAAAKYAKDNNLSSANADDMKKINDWLEQEANREDK